MMYASETWNLSRKIDNSSNTNGNGKKNVGYEMGRETDKRFNLRRDETTWHSRENQTL